DAGHRAAPPSCPTRRSSDLFFFLREGAVAVVVMRRLVAAALQLAHQFQFLRADVTLVGAAISHQLGNGFFVVAPFGTGAGVIGRSEEHTSELQSRENLVCRL